MGFSIHGVAVSRGVVLGRAVLISSSRAEVRHYFIRPENAAAEIARLSSAREAVVAELEKLQENMPADAPHELAALLNVHLMLLQDEDMEAEVKKWVQDRRYNAEWALITQLDIIVRQFDNMSDPYLRERKADMEQVVERILVHMRGEANKVQLPALGSAPSGEVAVEGGVTQDLPLLLVAHDLSPADMLQFKQSVFAGFVTDVGGKTSHTAIVARSMGIPAIVGARTASQLIRQDDIVIIDGDAGTVIVDPSPIIFEEYRFKQRQTELERERLLRLLHTPAMTIDDQKIELLANIEGPSDVPRALKAGALGVGLFRSEFLFMNRGGKLPNEEEQYQAYCQVVEGMQGLPVTIRTIDVGADKPLDDVEYDAAHMNPALGLRAIRWCLAEPTMFLTQLRAILRASAQGKIRLLIPMLAHVKEIHQTLAYIEKAKRQLDARGMVYGEIEVGAMIEVPAAALMVNYFLLHFDFLSVGTNDLIQYLLAIDRADESVANLYDPLHPAVLRLLAQIIAAGRMHEKSVCICGEMAGDPAMTKLLLGLGLRSFSMHPSQILSVKQEILRSDTHKLSTWAKGVLAKSEDVVLDPP